MFDFTDKAAIKIDDLLLFEQEEIDTYIDNNQMLFKDLVLDFSPSGQTAYGYNQQGHLVKIAYDDKRIKKIVLRTDLKLHKQIKMTIAYDGHSYHGFQYQKNQASIQGEVSRIIGPMIGQEALVQGASRTDAFVHAYGQVIHFDHCLDIDAQTWKTLLNHQLPKDIRVKDVCIQHPLFHSRYDVYKKTYIYKIQLGEIDPFLTNYVHFEDALDVKAMDQALASLKGTHDFTSFSKTKVDDPIRTIFETQVKQSANQVIIKIVGNGFLRYMVRIIVDYLIKIGKNQAPLSLIDVLHLKNRQYTSGIADPQGLYLYAINY